ncbi:hypothetical protein [Nonomuraea sp. LPB2021202275-12-8]|uniref:hypothetical protein n=1 Tax=Nonomuraea sp. LPB2021202275-12-8 TaxID=3120159 RepID=UPI00300BFC21
MKASISGYQVSIVVAGRPGFTLRVYSHLMSNAADRARRAMNAFFEGAADVSRALDVPSEHLI